MGTAEYCWGELVRQGLGCSTPVVVIAPKAGGACPLPQHTRTGPHTQYRLGHLPQWLGEE